MLLVFHFFPDKKANKISQGFLQELMLKMVDKVDAKIVDKNTN